MHRLFDNAGSAAPALPFKAGIERFCREVPAIREPLSGVGEEVLATLDIALVLRSRSLHAVEFKFPGEPGERRIEHEPEDPIQPDVFSVEGQERLNIASRT